MADLLIYTPRQSNRLQYVLEEIFRFRFGVSFELTGSLDTCMAHSGPLILYSNEPGLPSGLRIPESGFLFETGIPPHEPDVIMVGQIPALFPVKEARDAWLPFDLFALAFYLLSRYEEYQPFLQDSHGRFPASESLAFRHGFLEIPIVDTWLSRFRDHLNTVFHGLKIARQGFSFLPTIDVDQMWAFTHKPFRRKAGGLFLELLQGRFCQALQRLTVWAGLSKDPFDSFQLLRALHPGKSPVFFFLAADPGPFDVNNPVEDPAFGQIVRQVAEWSEIGLHPSYKSADDPEALPWEKQRLERIAGKEISKSRQHFLRLSLPLTYRRLLEAGIREDYSMGYADAPGFRAGTAVPFHWYDLEREMQTGLLVVPFQAMDVSLRQYLLLSPEEAVAKAVSLCKTVAENGGFFTTIWHNSSFDEKGDWKGWTQVYTRLLTEICYLYDKEET